MIKREKQIWHPHVTALVERERMFLMVEESNPAASYGVFVVGSPEGEQVRLAEAAPTGARGKQRGIKPVEMKINDHLAGQRYPLELSKDII